MEHHRQAAAARRRLLVLLIGPLLGLVLPELALRNTDLLWRHLARIRDANRARADGILGLAQPGEAGIVVLGSSMAYYDVDEGRLDDPRRTLNLAVAGDLAVDCAMTLPRALRLRPRMIVYVVSVYDLSRTYHPRSAGFYDPFVAWRLFSLSEIVRDADWHLRGLEEWASVARRHGPSLLPDLLLPGRWSDRSPAGRDSAPLAGESMREAVAGAELRLARNPFDGRGRNVEALRLMAARAARDGIPLVLVQAPLHPRVTGVLRAADGGYSATLEDLLERVARETPSEPLPGVAREAPRGLRDVEPTAPAPGAALVHHLPGPSLGSFEASLFRDGLHLQRRGRLKYTAALRDALAAISGRTHAVQ